MHIPLILLLFSVFPVLADPVVIGHPGLSLLDLTILERIYTGKIIEVNGTRVTPVNLPPGNVLRTRFLQNYLQQDEDKYTGYWTVRRYVGKGTPPRELGSSDEVSRFIAKTAGAIGYIEKSALTPDVKLLLPEAP